MLPFSHDVTAYATGRVCEKGNMSLISERGHQAAVE